jgi:thiosulfate reductase cytochrome b subunit
LEGQVTEDAITGPATRPARPRGPLVYRQTVATRVTHWTWAICLFFLLLTGLQIFNAHPTLYIGQQSGFGFDNAILELGAEQTDAGVRGYTTIFGQKFDTTGVFGKSGSDARPAYQGFPSWATIPSYRDLATGRVIHFFFGWIFLATMLVWFLFSFFNGHLKRDVVVRPKDVKELPRDIADHATFRFHHTKTYGPLQRLAYSVVFFILFPLIILTGLGMSPGMDSAWPWLIDMWGGRQTARTVHFITMVLLVLFFVVHIVMVLLAGPFNELRSMITGWYRTSPGTVLEPGDKSK